LEDDDVQTLEDAKRWLRARWEEGADCPCCGQFVKLYKRKLNGSMAYALILIYRYFEPNYHGWLHVPSYLNEAPIPAEVSAAIRGDWAKLRFWDLLIEDTRTRDDGSRRAGFWRITEHGRLFVRGLVRVPKYVYLYNKKVVQRRSPDGTSINIKEALGDKFNYSELMAATPEQRA